MGRQVFIHPQENGAPLPLMMTCEDKHHRSKSPPLPFFFLQWCCMEWDVPWVRWGQLCTPSLLTGVVLWKAEEASAAQKLYPAVKKPTPELPTLFTEQIQNTAHASYYEKKIVLTQSKPAEMFILIRCYSGT